MTSKDSFAFYHQLVHNIVSMNTYIFYRAIVLCLLVLTGIAGCKKKNYVLSAEPFQAPAAKLAFEPKRGITIDRQYHSVPDPMHIEPAEIALIKTMGFGFVKLISNPAIHKQGASAINMAHIEKMIRLVTDQGLPVVLTIHPEPDFKHSVFGTQEQFDLLLKWYESFARILSAIAPPDRLAFQLMTEPFGDNTSPYAWNYWNKLQPALWKAVRRGMPKHTMILSGSAVGRIEGLAMTEPVDDENVVYTFSHYEPFLFTMQGAYWPGFANTYFNFVRNVPYPSDPALIETQLAHIISDVPDAIKPEAIAALKQYGAERWNMDKLRARMKILHDWNQLHGGKMKIFAGEFGVLLKTVRPSDRYRFIKDFRQVFEENRMGWSYWSFNETFTVLKDGQQDPEMLDALLDR